MAIIVEDGSIVPGANSYGSEAGLAAYAAARGITIAGTAAELLIIAMDWIEQKVFKGYKLTEDQPLQWPRGWVEVDGYYLSQSSIPTLLIEAQYEACIAIDGGYNPLAVQEREVSSETVGPISVTYKSGTSTLPVLTAANNKLRKLLKSSGALAGIRV